MQEETTNHGNNCHKGNCEMHRADLQYGGESGDGWDDEEADSEYDEMDAADVWQ